MLPENTDNSHSKIPEEILGMVQAAVTAAINDNKKEIGNTFWDTKSAAKYLNVSQQYLEIARHRGEGPAFYRLLRRIRYRRSDLDDWMDKRRQDPEAE